MTARIRAQVTAAAIFVALFLGLESIEAQAAGGRHPGPSDVPPQHNDVRNGTRDLTYGRAVILRAGEIPRPSPPAGAADSKRTIGQGRRTHYLDTTLPVIIQGAPQRWVMRRYVAMG